MKKLVVLFTCLALFFMVGCAGKTVNPDYAAYTAAVSDIVKNQPPTFSLKCPPTGCVFKELSYTDPRDRIIIQQKNPHPAWAFASQAVRFGFYGFAAYQITDVLQASLASAGSEYHNSFNEVGGDNYNMPTNVGSDRGVVGDVEPQVGNENQDSFNGDRDSNNTMESFNHEPEEEEDGGWE